jgi:nucleoside phosphorylase
MPGRSYTGRAVILTAIEVEFMAALEHLVDAHEEMYHSTIYERGNFITEKWQWGVGIGQIGAGNSASAAAVERAITYFKPEIILFVGIAGGVKDVRIGDVVAVTKAYGYESGKMDGTGFLARPEAGMSSFRLVERAKAEARKKTWLRRIPGYPHLSLAEPRAFVGPIAAGEKVIASTSSDLFDFLRRSYNDTLAVEMEGRGFLEAARANEHVQALIIRGISDLLDNKSTYDAQGSQELAARHAAAFAFEVLAQLDTPQELYLRDTSEGGVTVQDGLTGSNYLGGEGTPAPALASVSRTAGIAPPLEIYYSFAPVKEDEILVGQFAKQLAMLRDQKRITEWHRSKILPGQVVHVEVTRHLNAAHIILLFISPDYMVCDECMYDMSRAIERHASGKATVIPILLRPVAMLGEAPFGHIQGFPRNGRPISDFGNRRGSVFAEIANEISAVVKDFT